MTLIQPLPGSFLSKHNSEAHWPNDDTYQVWGPRVSNFLSEHNSKGHWPNEDIYTKFGQNQMKTVGVVVLVKRT